MKLSSSDDFSHGDTFLKIKQKHPEINDFSSNINSSGIEGFNGKNVETLKHYPVNEEKIEELIGKIYGIPKEKIIATSGMTSLINYVYQLYTGKKVLLIEPIFSEHRRAAEASGCKITRLPWNSLKENIGLLKNFNYDIASINIPVNPTGEVLEIQEIEKIIKISLKKDAFVFIDQAYVEFLPEKQKQEVINISEDYPNIICGRSLTKVSGLPGIRLGFGVCSRELIPLLGKIRGPWTIPEEYYSLIERWNEFKPDIGLIRKEREFICEELGRMNFRIIGKSQVNFLSFSVDDEIDPVYFENKLVEKGYLIRNIGNFYGFTERDFRIGIRSHEKNKNLMDAIKEAASGQR